MTPDPADTRYCPEWLQAEPDPYWDGMRRRRNRGRLALAAALLLLPLVVAMVTK